MFDAVCAIHKMCIYRHLILNDANSELYSCNDEMIWHEVEGMFALICPSLKSPKLLSCSVFFKFLMFRPVFVDLSSVKMFVGTHARLMGTLSS